jgi:Peptidase A4 family
MTALSKFSKILAVPLVAAGFVVPALTASAAPVTHGPAQHATTPAASKVHPDGGTVYSSPNWAGWAADSSTYTQVTANWTVPTADCTDDAPKYASFWVGLDGWSSSTVEQTGTDSDCDNGVPTYYGWFEMAPYGAGENYGGTVDAGDLMVATVVYLGSNRFKLTLTDSTQNWSVDTYQLGQPGDNRSSAEVIAEDPTVGTGIAPLTNFGTVHFYGAEVDLQPLGNFNPDETIIVNANGLLVGVGHISDGENFNATYEVGG